MYSHRHGVVIGMPAFEALGQDDVGAGEILLQALDEGQQAAAHRAVLEAIGAHPLVSDADQAQRRHHLVPADLGEGLGGVEAPAGCIVEVGRSAVRDHDHIQIVESAQLCAEAHGRVVRMGEDGDRAPFKPSGFRVREEPLDRFDVHAWFHDVFARSGPFVQSDGRGFAVWKQISPTKVDIRFTPKRVRAPPAPQESPQGR